MRTARKSRCLGILRPEDVLTKEGVMRAAGIGENTLIDARKTGSVEAIPVGERVYFRGSDLIAWILSHSKREGR